MLGLYLNTRKATEEEQQLFNKMLVDARLKYKDKHVNIRNAHQKALYEINQTLVDAKKFKHVAVLKASGLDITELIIRFIVYLCLRNNDLQGSQMIIFTGPRLELAISIISRLKAVEKFKDWMNSMKCDDRAINYP